MKRIEVVLVDDHPLIREGLKNIINTQVDMVVVGEAENGAQAIKIVRELKPNVVVLDIALPDLNGLEVATQIRKFSTVIGQEIHIIILSMFLKENLVYKALQIGAKGYIVKSSPSSEIVSAIHNVCQNRYYLGPQVSTSIIPEYLQYRQSKYPKCSYDLLTEREQQIFRLVADGRSNRDIADMLCISSKTVERHRANLMSKLDVHNYKELLRLAIDLGILDLSV